MFRPVSELSQLGKPREIAQVKSLLLEASCRSPTQGTLVPESLPDRAAEIPVWTRELHRYDVPLWRFLQGIHPTLQKTCEVILVTGSGISPQRVRGLTRQPSISKQYLDCCFPHRLRGIFFRVKRFRCASLHRRFRPRLLGVRVN